jgi:hypothetical protein
MMRLFVESETTGAGMVGMTMSLVASDREASHWEK